MSTEIIFENEIRIWILEYFNSDWDNRVACSKLISRFKFEYSSILIQIFKFGYSNGRIRVQIPVYSNTFQILEYSNFNSIKLNSSIITIQIKRLKFKFVYFRNPTYSNTRIFKFNFKQILEWAKGKFMSRVFKFTHSTFHIHVWRYF